ncbi:hypothetical protein F2P81_008802 [Scophthalmus maximus]|uniref:Uncharacterized protein n=1 Tax=Scophthalmus maximus TaxID=52904 RepID=A0A6A4T1W8_SCOMX|nr:hypothetical protein F2P81_008802 [Scophthalmus maximus]
MEAATSRMQPDVSRRTRCHQRPSAVMPVLRQCALLSINERRHSGEQDTTQAGTVQLSGPEVMAEAADDDEGSAQQCALDVARREMMHRGDGAHTTGFTIERPPHWALQRRKPAPMQRLIHTLPVGGGDRPPPLCTLLSQAPTKSSQYGDDRRKETVYRPILLGYRLITNYIEFIH